MSMAMVTTLEMVWRMVLAMLMVPVHAVVVPITSVMVMIVLSIATARAT